ncbi:VIT1/CCC1 transporter family protein [Bauldia sp.]|uniref:VIT1/CCC1 transporter family protein n=1 Tax=Bauldia sp. TaxID=2575872 RepID=UPI003BAA8BE6
MKASADDVARYRANLQGEVDSIALYSALAEAEANPKIAEVYRRLAAVEQTHAEFWQRQLHSAGADYASLRPGFRAQVLAWLARRFSAATMLPAVAVSEARDQAVYKDQPEAIAAGLPTDEQSHARVIGAAMAGTGGLAGSEIAKLEGRHRAGAGNALRAAVLGANDGLVSNTSLVMGVAGASAAEQTILLAGLAGLIAGACSMAMGEWLSVNSARELAQRQIAMERSELAQFPEQERQELVLIYQAKGLTEEEAKSVADRLLADDGAAVDTLAREELGIDPKELGGSAWVAGASSFFLFALGAIFPVAPFFFLTGTAAMVAALASSGGALILIGIGTSLFTGRGVMFSALRQLLIGYAAAAITYGVGALVGVSLQ